MRVEKYYKLLEIIENSDYKVDLLAGNVISKKGIIGHIKYSKRSKIGLKVVSFWFKGKRYSYTVADVIMVCLGKITEKNCETAVVENISKNSKNTSIYNLRVITQNELCQIEHIKKIISAYPTEKYRFESYDTRKVWVIEQLKTNGKKPMQIHKITGYNYHTIKKYYYKGGLNEN